MGIGDVYAEKDEREARNEARDRSRARYAPHSCPAGEHCWHFYVGAFMMVLKPGHILQSCCKCDAHRQVHRDHA